MYLFRSCTRILMPYMSVDWLWRQNVKLLSHSQFTKSQDMQVWRAIAGKAVSYITALYDYSVLFLYPPRKNNVFFVTHTLLQAGKCRNRNERNRTGRFLRFRPTCGSRIVLRCELPNSLLLYARVRCALKKLTPINLKFRNIVYPTAVIVKIDPAAYCSV